MFHGVAFKLFFRAQSWLQGSGADTSKPLLSGKPEPQPISQTTNVDAVLDHAAMHSSFLLPPFRDNTS